MDLRPTTLRFSHTADSSLTRRECTLIAQDKVYPPIWVEIPGLNLDPPLVWDGFLFGLLLWLMETGKAVHIEGPISLQALRNAIELQDVWALWCPDRYKRVEIEADTVIDLPSSSTKPVINAFSGGADSIFSLLRHRLKWLGPASRDVGGALLVHGFDIPLSDNNAFEQLVKRCSALLREMEVPLYVARTNLRSANQLWDHSFAAQIACCLHQFAGDYSGGIIGSSEPYDNQVFPWGSTPITDPLLSGAFTVIHDGAGYSRTAKLEHIRHNDLALRTLKVCWAGSRRDENCGECEKCTRTRLNLLAVGVSAPECFDGPLELSAVRRMTIPSTIHAAELQSILNYARDHDIDDEWVNVLQARLNRYRVESRISALKERARGSIGDSVMWRAARWLKRRN